MQSILNFIKSIFKKTSKSLDNSILFRIDNNQETDFKFDINNYSKDSAEKLGLLLFLISEGYYVQSFLDSLTSLYKDDKNKQEFVQQVVGSWATNISANETYEASNAEPIIKPSQFNSK